MNTEAEFESQLKIFQQELERSKYTWISRGDLENNTGVYIRFQADFKRDIVGKGKSWNECFCDAIEKIKTQPSQ